MLLRKICYTIIFSKDLMQKEKMMIIPPYPHSETIETLIENLETSQEGLSDDAVTKQSCFVRPKRDRRKEGFSFLPFLLLTV